MNNIDKFTIRVKRELQEEAQRSEQALTIVNCDGGIDILAGPKMKVL